MKSVIRKDGGDVIIAVRMTQAEWDMVHAANGSMQFVHFARLAAGMSATDETVVIPEKCSSVAEDWLHAIHSLDGVT